MKFIHCADLHIDSPLRGLDLENSDHNVRIRRASRDAFSNMLSLAIEQQVDFIVIAGDLFDGQWPDMRTGLWTAEQFRRLREHRIRVYLIRGNHDALSVVAPHVKWPEDVVCEFDTTQPTTFVDERSGAVLHGQSYADRRAPGDLAASYPPAVKDAFNIGVLHTSLEGNADHIPYAPTKRETLISRGYDYWALGHVHQRAVLAQSPHIVFSGNTQGRHIKETGAKGCYVVTVEDGAIRSCDFHETDVIRWQVVELPLQPADEEADLFERLQGVLDKTSLAAEGRPVVVRVNVNGATNLHEQLITTTASDRIQAEIRNQASNTGDIWVEQISFATRPAIDIEELRQGADVVGELLRSIDRQRQDDDELQILSKHLQPLFDKLGDLPGDGDQDMNLHEPANLRRWLNQAENLLLGELLEHET